MLFLLLVYVFMKLNLKLRFIQDSMSTTPMISCSRVVRYESGSHTVGNRSNINIIFRIFNVNIMHLKPYVSYLEYGNALKVWRSSSLLLYSLCTSLETDDISSWSEWYVSVVYSCWFLDDGNIHSYRIRYHDSYLGRSIKGTMLSWNGRSCCSEYAVFQCHGRGISAVEPAAYLETAA